MSSRNPARLSFGALLAEQVRVVGLSLQREAMFMGGALLLLCIVSLVMALRYQERLDLEASLLQPTLFLAAWLPSAVWKADKPFGRAYLWTLPVQRQVAAVAKVVAGAVWMFAALAVVIVALALVAWVSGGSIDVGEERWLISATGELRRIIWTPPAWLWLLPFSGATIVYLFASAAMIGLRHPVRTLLGVAVAIAMLMFLLVGVAPDGVVEHFGEGLRETLWSGAYGLDFALSDGGGSLSRRIVPAVAGHHRAWIAVPEISRWALATAVWLGVAAAALALAIRRHWER